MYSHTLAQLLVIPTTNANMCEAYAKDSQTVVALLWFTVDRDTDHMHLHPCSYNCLWKDGHHFWQFGSNYKWYSTIYIAILSHLQFKGGYSHMGARLRVHLGCYSQIYNIWSLIIHILRMLWEDMNPLHNGHPTQQTWQASSSRIIWWGSEML